MQGIQYNNAAKYGKRLGEALDGLTIDIVGKIKIL
jgi:hypothetical protein